MSASPVIDEPPHGSPIGLAKPRSRRPLWRQRLPDGIFEAIVMACGLAVIGAVGLVFYELVRGSLLTLEKFSWHFFTGSNWDPVAGDFGALPFVYGTLVSSALALLLAAPLGVGVAVFTTEMCPRAMRASFSFVTELLAAIPSVIYGLWAMFVLVPLLRNYVEPWLGRNFGWTGLFSGTPFGIGMLAAGLILAIMVVPIISSITREILTSVPQAQREGVLALGATRWEMIRLGVLRNARAGILGAIILGLGRALGETIAVSMVIGNRPEISRSLFAPGHTMASVLALEFSEAGDPLYLSALMEVGLSLFLVTFVVNALARLLVWVVTRGLPAAAHAQ